MPLLTKSQISTGQYSYDGSPWIKIAAKSSINLDTLEYSYDGSPWYGVEDTATVDNFIKVSGVNYSSIVEINGVAKASITKMNTIPK